jgi:hypothetical protein
MQPLSSTAATGLKLFATTLLILAVVGFILVAQKWLAGATFRRELILSSIALFGAWRMFRLSRRQEEHPF